MFQDHEENPVPQGLLDPAALVVTVVRLVLLDLVGHEVKQDPRVHLGPLVPQDHVDNLDHLDHLEIGERLDQVDHQDHQGLPVC